MEAAKKDKWFELAGPTIWTASTSKEPDGKVFMAINRWMKRRIERSRARCDRAETKKSDKLDQHKRAESATDQHGLEPIRSLNV
jgi:hypothetical protein